MPKCVKCLNLFHPDWCVEETIRGDEVIICCFCKTQKDTLTVTNEDDKVVETITKNQASENYKRWLDELSQKPNIAKIINDNK